MSGGKYEYAFAKLNDIADDFAPLEDHLEARRKVAEILRHMADICHGIEWIDSHDWGPERWAEIEDKLDRIKLF